MEPTSESSKARSFRTVAPALAAVALACGGGGPAVDARTMEGEAGELFLPPSATAPRVMREALPPDTFRPDTSGEFAILGVDSFPLTDLSAGLPGSGLAVDAIAASYRAHYAAALDIEGSAVRNRIDRELQHEAERRTARDRGFADWSEMIGALSPEQRARLVERLNAANLDLARELHGSGGEPAAGEPEAEAPASEG